MADIRSVQVAKCSHEVTENLPHWFSFVAELRPPSEKPCHHFRGDCKYSRHPCSCRARRVHRRPHIIGLRLWSCSYLAMQVHWKAFPWFLSLILQFYPIHHLRCCDALQSVTFIRLLIRTNIQIYLYVKGYGQILEWIPLSSLQWIVGVATRHWFQLLSNNTRDTGFF